MKPKVLLDVPFPPFLEEVFTPVCELVPWSVLDETAGPLTDIRGVLTYSHATFGDAELDRLPALEIVSNYGVGVDHIDVAAVTARGIPVGNTPGTVDGATADMTMALMLAIARNIVPGDAYARGPKFTHYDPGMLLGRDVFGACLGIVGMGRIGQEVARRASGFDMRILYHNRKRNEEAEARLGAQYADLGALLEQADFVVINTPLTDATRGLIGAAELRKMRADAYLINTARGAIIDHDALLTALSEHWIAGAAVDVTEPEPLPRGHPLLTLDNLLIAPHLGTGTFGTRLRMARVTADNLIAGLEGRALAHSVTA